MIHDIFPTPILTTDLKEQIDLSRLKELVSKINFSEHGLIDNGSSSYTLDNKILDKSEFLELKQTIISEVRLLQRELSIRQLSITNSWINRMEKNSHVGEHVHGMSVLSGAFYIDAEQDSGNLFLKNPNHEFQMLYDKIEDCAYTQEYIEVDVTSGVLVLFPSWLRHHVQNNNYKDRLVLSFNTTYTDYIKKTV